MSKVVPSQVVQVINELFPQFNDQVDSQAGRISLHPGDAGNVSAIVDLLYDIPNELVVLGPNEDASSELPVAC